MRKETIIFERLANEFTNPDFEIEMVGLCNSCLSKQNCKKLCEKANEYCNKDITPIREICFGKKKIKTWNIRRNNKKRGKPKIWH